jgi:hypothetical protein
MVFPWPLTGGLLAALNSSLPCATSRRLVPVAGSRIAGSRENNSSRPTAFNRYEQILATTLAGWNGGGEKHIYTVTSVRVHPYSLFLSSLFVNSFPVIFHFQLQWFIQWRHISHLFISRQVFGTASVSFISSLSDCHCHCLTGTSWKFFGQEYCQGSSEFSEMRLKEHWGPYWDGE